MGRLTSPLFIPIFFILAFLSLVLADNNDTVSDGDSLPTDLLRNDTSMGDFGKMLDKNPELQELVMGIYVRYKTGANASEEDLNEFRGLLDSAQQQVYDFVTGPQYKNYTNLFIEQAVQLMAPLIAIVPLKDIRKFFDIIKKDPKLSQAFYGGLSQGQTYWQTVLSDKQAQNEAVHEFIDGFVSGVREGLQEQVSSTDADNLSSTEEDASTSTETVVSNSTEASLTNSTSEDASNSTDTVTTLPPPSTSANS